ncbi:MAG: response regulator [Spirochaetia bacterium]
MRIAIAEDETLPAITLQAGLLRSGYDVLRPVATGRGMLELARHEKIDAVIMDINLRGEVKGIEAAEQLKNINPDLKVIFVTGYEDQTSYEKAMKLKPAGFIRKPFMINDITAVLEEISSS